MGQMLYQRRKRWSNIGPLLGVIGQRIMTKESLHKLSAAQTSCLIKYIKYILN